mgnify:CR=1 FL=1
MLGFMGTTLGQDFVDVLHATEAQSVILFARNIVDATQCRDLIAALRAAVPWPLLVAVDQEGGAVVRLTRGATVFAGNMALGAAADVQLAYDVGLASGRELAAIGFDLNLAPVVDLQTNPRNPGIGIRSFGSDRNTATELAAAFVRGHAVSQVACCWKHFPGKGAASVDAHVDLPVLELTLDEFRDPHVRIFEDLFVRVAARDACVMTTHVLVRGLDPRSPATLSRRVASDFLRGELGFEGLVLADDLEMGAIEKYFPIPEAAVEAAIAGHDVLPICHDAKRQLAAGRALDAALESGRLDALEHEAALVRIGRCAHRHHGQDGRRASEPVLDEVQLGEGAKLAQEVAERAYTILADPQSLLPLPLDSAVLVIAVRPHAVIGVEENADRDWRGLVEACFAQAGLQGQSVRAIDLEDLARDPEREYARLFAGVEGFARVVLLSYHARLESSMQALLVEACARCPSRLVVAHLRNPFDQALLPTSVSAVTTYGYRVCHLRALARGLVGAFEARARMPAPWQG